MARFFTFNTARMENMVFRDDPESFFGKDIDQYELVTICC